MSMIDSSLPTESEIRLFEDERQRETEKYREAMRRMANFIYEKYTEKQLWRKLCGPMRSPCADTCSCPCVYGMAWSRKVKEREMLERK